MTTQQNMGTFVPASLTVYYCSFVQQLLLHRQSNSDWVNQETRHISGMFWHWKEALRYSQIVSQTKRPKDWLRLKSWLQQLLSPMADALSKQGLVLRRKCTGLQGSQAISFTVYSRQLAKASPCTWHIFLQSFWGETVGMRFLYLTALQSIWTAAVTLRSFSNPKRQSSFTWPLLRQTGLCKQHKSLPCSCLPIPSALKYHEYISNHLEARSWGP